MKFNTFQQLKDFILAEISGNEAELTEQIRTELEKEDANLARFKEPLNQLGIISRVSLAMSLVGIGVGLAYYRKILPLEVQLGHLCEFVENELSAKDLEKLRIAINEWLESYLEEPLQVEDIKRWKVDLAEAIQQAYSKHERAGRDLDVFLGDVQKKMGDDYPLDKYEGPITNAQLYNGHRINLKKPGATHDQWENAGEWWKFIEDPETGIWEAKILTLAKDTNDFTLTRGIEDTLRFIEHESTRENSLINFEPYTIQRPRCLDALLARNSFVIIRNEAFNDGAGIVIEDTAENVARSMDHLVIGETLDAAIKHCLILSQDHLNPFHIAFAQICEPYIERFGKCTMPLLNEVLRLARELDKKNDDTNIQLVHEDDWVTRTIKALEGAEQLGFDLDRL